MSIYFTLCSNNYLPFALSLGQSINTFDPQARFVIGLVDKLDKQIDYSLWDEFEFIPCFDLGYPEFQGMLSRYNIIEFNTAVKPFYFEYLFDKNPSVTEIFYLDPDLFFYQHPNLMRSEFQDADILLTPNLIYTQSQASTGELASLRHGMYNLGFLGLRRSVESLRLISWWKERLIEHCRIDKCWGIFVDQKWMDLAPLFFDRIKLVKHPGWNMAWWNFNERKLVQNSSGYWVNTQDQPLVFFHFSGFKPENSHLTERVLTKEFEEAENQALSSLYAAYREVLLKNDYEKLSRINPSLQFREVPNSYWNRLGRSLKSKTLNAINKIFRV